MPDPSSEPSDVDEAALAALVQQAAAGDPRALDDLLSRYRNRLKRMVHLRLNRRLQGRVDDSDVVQEAYLEVARSFRSMRRIRRRRSSCGCGT